MLAIKKYLIQMFLLGAWSLESASAEDSGFWWGSSLEFFTSNGDLYNVGQVGYQWGDN